MEIEFLNLSKKLRANMNDFLLFHKIKEGNRGLKIKITTDKINYNKIIKNKDNVEFIVGKEERIFRLLTILKRFEDRESTEYKEDIYFESCGAMFDGSQASSLMNINTLKKMLIIFAGMGLNSIMLYTEDCYEVTGEPYFGNMRPKFTKEDFKKIDSYANSLGIELIPCIELLGHLKELIKKPPYKEISDTPTILMAGEEKVYTLIEKIIKQISETFMTKKIHIGCDEAWDLGLGNYRLKNGYVPPAEIMSSHLKRVSKIVDKYKLKPMMWSDMFFNNKANTNEYYVDDIKFDEKDRANVPKNMQLIYWDYYHEKKEEYIKYIKFHKDLKDDIVFAGCSRNVRTFASHYEKTKRTSNPALLACKEEKIKNVFATVWGDDHRESSNFSVLPGLQLYAEHMYCKNPKEEEIKRRFFESTMSDFNAFTDISDMDCFPDDKNKNLKNKSLTRAIMWQDILLGLCDKNLGNKDYEKYYLKICNKMKENKKENPYFKDLFNFMEKLALCLSLKANMGIEIERAYRENNLTELKNIRENKLPLLSQYVCDLRDAHYEHFMTEYKPVGWEIMDIRYGGIYMRINTAIRRIDDYLKGKISKIDELSEERLSMTLDNELPERINYQDICSASSL